MDSVDFKNMSLEERDCVAQEILRKRYAVDKPETLKLLAIKAICSNYKLFLKQNGNPLEILPGTIIKDFLGLIKEYRWTTHILIPKQDEMKFVLLLLNPNLTEFDPQEFNPYVRGSIAPHQVYYKHMVKNCPKITKIVKCCCRFCQGVVPLLKIAKFLKADLLAWKNLRYFGMKGTMCADRELQRISKYIPNLEGLEVSLSRHTLSTKAVKYFSKMKKLKHLDIGIMKCNYGCSIFYEHCPDMDLILKCLEKLSNLQTFQFDDTFDNFNNVEDFVESFGLFYPNKKLIAPRLNICSPFEFDWPENLLVKELEIHGDLSEGTIQKLISMPNFPKKLIIAVTPFRDIYPILEVLGPHLEELHFIDSDYVDFLDLDHVGVPYDDRRNSLNSQLAEGNGFSKVTLKHFRNWRKFAIEGFNCAFEGAFDEGVPVLLKIYQMFVLGSENYDRTLKVSHLASAKLLLQTLKENTTCLSDLQKVWFQVNSEELIAIDIQICQILILRSPYLKKIKFILYGLEFSNEDKRFIDFVTNSLGIQFKVILEDNGENDSSYVHTDLDDFPNNDL